MEHGHPTYLAIRQANGSLIGVLSFTNFFMGIGAKIGYWLPREWWDQGIMTAAVGAACHHAFFQWNADVILASCFQTNVASRRVLEKNGFELEGRHQLVKDGLPIVSWMYVAEAPPF